VALARGDELLANERRAMRHGHAETLLPMIAAAVGQLSPAAIKIVAACVGPGGFTGIRVGLAAAQGIALGADVETIGVTSFAAVAAALAHREERGPVLVAIDSRRSELYLQLIAASGEPIAPPVAILPNDIKGYVDGLIGDTPLRIAGDAAEIAAAALPGRDGLDRVAGSAPDALGVLAAARLTWRSDRKPQPLTPVYLRSPDVSFPKQRAPVLRRAR
jgi:tRNA threonylcarbamoyladenosine biosynthesis protein TsaB